LTRCPPDKIIYDHLLGLKVCVETGEVLEEDLIDDSPDWRAYSAEEEIRRARAQPIAYTKPEFGIGAHIDKLRISKVRSILANPPPVPTVKGFGRSRKHMQSLAILNDMMWRLGLPKWLQEEAGRLYYMVSTRGLMRGRDVKLALIAIIYLAMRVHSYPMTMEELINAVGFEPTLTIKREVGRLYREFSRMLGVSIKPMRPEDFVPVISGKLNVSPDVVSKALEILRSARERGLISYGKDPVGFACAAIYLASNRTGARVRQYDVAKVAGVTEVTVRNRVRDLQKILGEDS
jgi:transcription initiation factor TFIIB